MKPPRQGLLFREIPRHPELPQATQQRCRELLSQMILDAVNHTSTGEENDEREDPIVTHGS